MSIFSRKDRKPRIAYREQRNGVKHYYVETWECYPDGCDYYQDSRETTSLKKAEQMLKKITDEEIIGRGIIKED